MKYENGLIFAEGNLVMAHGRFRDPNGTSITAANIMWIEEGIFMEHWDAIQEDAKREQSRSGLPMFGSIFPE